MMLKFALTPTAWASGDSLGSKNPQRGTRRHSVVPELVRTLSDGQSLRPMRHSTVPLGSSSIGTQSDPPMRSSGLPSGPTCTSAEPVYSWLMRDSRVHTTEFWVAVGPPLSHPVMTSGVGNAVA